MFSVVLALTSAQQTYIAFFLIQVKGDVLGQKWIYNLNFHCLYQILPPLPPKHFPAI